MSKRMGRPLKGTSRRIPITVYLPLDLLQKIDKIEGSRSDYIVQAIQEKNERESDHGKD